MKPNLAGGAYFVPLVSVLLSTTPVAAADLGGECCADLEERIAELEATTARKGNRKVALTISGWVAEQIVAWDDGVERNVYQGGVGTSLSSNVTFTGSAAISNDVTAGFVIRIETNPNDPFTLSQNNDDHNDPRLPDFAFGAYPYETYWYLQSQRLGKLSVGKLSPASDNASLLPYDASGTLFPANIVLFDPIRGFELRRNGAPVVNGVTGATLTWGDIGNCTQIGVAGSGIGGDCTATHGNFVRYDSPTLAGFSFSTTWGEDDLWDVAARYAGQWRDFKVAFGGAYSHNTDESFVVPVPGTGRRDVEYYQLGGYIEHAPTKIWLLASYGYEDNHNNARVTDNDDHWYVKAGIKLKPFSIGETIPYAEYGQHNDMLSILAPDATGSQINRWGIGVVQNIDAAAMSLWLAYRSIDGEIEGGSNAGELDTYKFIKGGAVINF